MAESFIDDQDQLIADALALLKEQMFFAASSMEVANPNGGDQLLVAAPELEHQDVYVYFSGKTKHRHADLVEQTLAVLRTTAEKQKTTSEGLPNLPSSDKWLDTERANIHRRVETFRATQTRFQHDRAEYCDNALAAAVAGEWKPT